MKGKIIVFEGIDGAGTETQSKLLYYHLKREGHKVRLYNYPDYKGPIGKLLHDYQYEKYDFSPEVQFMLYAADYIKDQKEIKKFLKSGGIVICDRYFTSTVAYQVIRGVPLDSVLGFARLFDIEKPFVTFYLKVPAKVSMKRKFEEKNNLDRNEGDVEFLERMVKFYNQIVKRKIFCRWVTVDGEKPIEDVFSFIRKNLDV